MRLVQPYKTVAGALRALDNGGRFYNLFTKAEDQVVTLAELKKVAGVFGDGRAAAMFFALATAELDDRERRRVVAAFGPKASEIHRRYAPASVGAREFATRARAGKGYVVEGKVKKFDDETVTGMIFMPISTGKVTTVVPIPTQSQFTVYELDGPNRGSECLVLTPKQSSPLRGRYRFVGLAKEAEVGEGKRKSKRLRLEAAYYSPVRGSGTKP